MTYNDLILTSIMQSTKYIKHLNYFIINNDYSWKNKTFKNSKSE